MKISNVLFLDIHNVKTIKKEGPNLQKHVFHCT